MKIRIGNDFRYNWLILWNEEAESFTDATDKRLTVTVYGRVTELMEGTDYTITGNAIAIDFTPAICDKTGSYNLALHYTKPSDKFIDGDRRSAVDVDAFIIVPKSEQSDSLEDITHTSDAVAMFLDVAYKKLDEIEAAEEVREVSEEGRVTAEGLRVTAEHQRAIDSAAAVENANDTATYANEQGAYAEEMSAHPPVIIADYWHNWNFTTNQYETTGQYARGDSAVEGALVVQETGQSAVNTMSQKAVTDELVQLAGDVNRKVDFIIPKNNLLNRNTELPNKIVNQTTGNIETHATHSASDWIAIDPSTNYYGNTNISRLAWYDENRVYISGELAPSMPITSPSNAKYIRVSYTPGNVYLVKGSSAVPYEEFKFLFSLLEVNTSQLAGDLPPAQTANFRLKSDLIAKEDTSFFSKGKNLFNKETYIPNALINPTTGAINPSSTNWASDYIKVQGGLPYYAIGLSRMAWYDANKVYISGELVPTIPITAPANAEYIRLSCSNDTSIHGFQFEQNTEATSYEPFYEIITRDSIAPWIDGVYRELGSKIEANDLDILERNKNLFIQETVVLGKYVNWTTGNIDTNLPYNASDFMPVEPDTDYFYNKGIHYALYDENKVFIEGKSGSYGGLIHTPVNAAFARISVLPINMETAQFEKGSLETSYVKGGYVHKSYIISEPSPVSLPVTEIVMPPKYVAVVGSPIQIFYHGLIKAINPYKYNLRVNCARGKDFRRYWEFTPQASDIGNHTLTLSLYDDANNQISTGSTTIEVVQFVQSPVTKKNILTVGDSLNNSAGDWGDVFAKQVVDGTDILTGLTAITNIDFVGELGVAPKQYTGQGGWSWSHYNIAPDPSTADIWVYATHDKDASDQESLWSDANSNIWQLETIEATRLKFKRYGGHTAAMPASPNALTHNMNAVHTATINYTSIQVAEQNPFWNANTSEVDFANWFSNKYPTKHSTGEGIDACFVMLGWNGGVYGKLTPEDWDDYVLTAKTFIDNLHADYPSCKVYVMGLQYPSLNGGLGNNYGAGANSYAELWSSIQSVQSLNKAYEALCDDAIYSSFCKFINISGQFDSEFNMPYLTTPVNLRSSITERRGSNGVHPSAEGYMQISDAAIRMLIKEFCQ